MKLRKQNGRTKNIDNIIVNIIVASCWERRLENIPLFSSFYTCSCLIYYRHIFNLKTDTCCIAQTLKYWSFTCCHAPLASFTTNEINSVIINEGCALLWPMSTTPTIENENEINFLCISGHLTLKPYMCISFCFSCSRCSHHDNVYSLLPSVLSHIWAWLEPKQKQLFSSLLPGTPLLIDHCQSHYKYLADCMCGSVPLLLCRATQPT